MTSTPVDSGRTFCSLQTRSPLAQGQRGLRPQPTLRRLSQGLKTTCVVDQSSEEVALSRGSVVIKAVHHRHEADGGRQAVKFNDRISTPGYLTTRNLFSSCQPAGLKPEQLLFSKYQISDGPIRNFELRVPSDIAPL